MMLSDVEKRQGEVGKMKIRYSHKAWQGGHGTQPYLGVWSLGGSPWVDLGGILLHFYRHYLDSLVI